VLLSDPWHKGSMGGIRAAGRRTAGEPVKVRTFRRSSVVNMSAPSRLHGRMENAPARSSTSQACRSLSHWCQSCKQPRLRHPLATTPPSPRPRCRYSRIGRRARPTDACMGSALKTARPSTLAARLPARPSSPKLALVGTMLRPSPTSKHTLARGAHPWACAAPAPAPRR